MNVQWKSSNTAGLQALERFVPTLRFSSESEILPGHQGLLLTFSLSVYPLPTVFDQKLLSINLHSPNVHNSQWWSVAEPKLDVCEFSLKHLSGHWLATVFENPDKPGAGTLL